MKASNSKDNVARFTVTIKRRVGLEELIDGIGWTVVRDSVDFEGADNVATAVELALKPFRSRKAIVDAAINSIRHDGDGVWTWSDSCNASNVIREQARALVLKKFPELRSGA